MCRPAIPRRYCLLVWSSLVLLDPSSAADRPSTPEGPTDTLVVAAGDTVRFGPTRSDVSDVDTNGANAGHYEVAIDGGALRPTGSTITAPTTAGSHWLAVARRDDAGALSLIRWVHLRVDDAGPAVTLDVSPSPVVDTDGTAWVPPQTRVQARALDLPAGVASTTLTANDAVVHREAAEAEIVVPDTGVVTVRAEAMDRVGNASQAEVLALRVDAEPPTGTIRVTGPQVEKDDFEGLQVEGDRGLVLGPSARLTVDVTDDDSGIESWTGLSAGEPIPQEQWLGAWAAGMHEASVRAVDRVGNERVVGPLAFLVDDQGPVISWTITDPGATDDAGARFYRSPVTLRVRATDPQAGVMTLEQSQAGRAGTWTPVENETVYEGTSLDLRAEDRVGNLSTTHAAWQVDDRAPMITVRGPGRRPVPADGRLALRVGDEVAVSVADAGCGVAEASYRLNHTAVPGRPPWRPVEGAITITRSGTQHLRVEAVDRLGHRTRATWRIDAAGSRP